MNATIDETTLTLLKMSKAYIDMGQPENADKCLTKALSVIDPPKFNSVRVTNGFQDPTPEPTPAATWDSEPMGGIML